MKIILKSIVVISFFITSQLAFAGSFVDSATVTSVEKVYKQYMVDEPYQDCYIQETIQNGDGSATNEIMGAILGGAIGNQFGEGDGNDAMTLAGIFLGASIANDAEKANAANQVVVSQEVCENGSSCDCINGCFWVIPRARSKWAEYLKNDPRCSWVIDDDQTMEKIICEGVAELVEENVVEGKWVGIADKMAVRYLGPDGPTYLVPTLNQPRWLFRLRPTKLRSCKG